MRDWSGELSAETAQKITDILTYVLSHRCAVVSIIKDICHIEVWTDQVADDSDGKVANLQWLPSGEPMITWSIADHAWSISPADEPGVKVSWWDGKLTIRQNAPAGHPLVWVVKPTISETEDDRS